TTSFVQCYPIQGTTTPPTLISITLNPDPVVPGKPDKFTVSGNLDSDITETTQLIVFYVDVKTNKSIVDGYHGPICKGTECPIKAKTPFSTNADIPTPQKLPNPYVISVAIVESPALLGCVQTIVGDVPA
ncbi:6892_t:CDS:1, partial [Funneliformis geosporum]